MTCPSGRVRYADVKVSKYAIFKFSAEKSCCKLQLSRIPWMELSTASRVQGARGCTPKWLLNGRPRLNFDDFAFGSISFQRRGWPCRTRCRRPFGIISGHRKDRFDHQKKGMDFLFCAALSLSFCYPKLHLQQSSTITSVPIRHKTSFEKLANQPRTYNCTPVSLDLKSTFNSKMHVR